MKLSSIQNPANIPSYFGAPICGHASDETAGFATFGTTAVARDRQYAFTGVMGLAADVQGTSVKGTSVWSPPPS